MRPRNRDENAGIITVRRGALHEGEEEEEEEGDAWCGVPDGEKIRKGPA